MSKQYESYHQDQNRKAAEVLVAAAEAGKPSMDEFHDTPGFAKSRVASDTSYAEKLKSQFAVQERSPNNFYAKALEAIMQSGISRGLFLHPTSPEDRTYAIPPTDYDDYVNGIDLAIECVRLDEDGEPESIPFAIDCTTQNSPEAIRNKILRLRKDKPSGRLFRPTREDGLPMGCVNMGYFFNQATGDKRKIDFLPRYTVGVSRDYIEGIVERADTFSTPPSIKNDPLTSLKLLLEMRAQNELFVDFATHGGELYDEDEADEITLTPDEIYAAKQFEAIDAIFQQGISDLIQRNPSLREKFTDKTTGRILSRERIVKMLCEEDDVFATIIETVEDLKEASSQDVGEESGDGGESIHTHHKEIGHRILLLLKQVA